MRCPAVLLACVLAACGASGGAERADGGPPVGGDGGTTDATPGAADARLSPWDAATQGGCGLAPGATGTSVHTMTVAGTERTYRLVVPDGYDPHTPHALVFAWHGRGSSGTIFRAYFGVETAAAGTALFVFPEGLGITNPQDTGWDVSPSGSVDVMFFDQMLATLRASYCIDNRRVFSTGHSFGGYMSNQLACKRSGDVRAIAPVAGGGPYGSCGGGVAAFIVHGSTDTVVPPSEGMASRDHWRDANGCGGGSEDYIAGVCERYLGCADAPVIFCLHSEQTQGLGGHGWPSFAGDEIWTFFSGFD